MPGIIVDYTGWQMSQTLMEIDAKPSALVGILRQRCPRCRAGRIFRGSIVRGFPKMYERCEICNLKFEREPGYFLGAMYVSYGLALATIAMIAALLWSISSRSIVKDIAWACILFLPLAPSLTLFARVLWIYLDQTIDPDRPA
jgi:uncharacterized protein (DUF983 family)